ncbi:class I SAM-dependent RNA methyltransferase [Hyphomicrobium sp.]|uniref:class I SAM-dependent RNA methyltransferase n=2 Tax=Hyphomicrobium sp. TaxID=82 RepID=UPI00132C7A86|nr:class I SAM-dependent RNA methyltransferase [Hyphomicrobium sp.]KAB2940094.1 MAG: class I SAM-dependent RNA methyltransferase [Hyphomicrobium sp.]
MGDTQALDVARLGAQGDGVADTASGPVFVPFALPGERVQADVRGERGRLIAIMTASPDRIAPVCRHFTHCGGCAVQHIRMPAYLAWKREMVVAAFAARGIDAPIAHVASVGLGARRRAAFSARRTGRGVVLGFHEAKGVDIVDVQECPVTASAIVRALPGLRRLAEPLMSRRAPGRVVVTLAANGLDVAIEDVPGDPPPEVREFLAREAAALKLARLTISGDTLYQATVPAVRFGTANVVLPARSFLQAAPAAEAEMVRLVTQAVGEARRVVDLFCGMGTITFPLAQRAPVLAVDGDKQAVAALQSAAKRTPGLKPIEAKLRDLFREPLSARELLGFDAAVFDPPRAGAATQAALLAESSVKTIAAVSCNPATLARDARILLDGGYKLERVTPIDQFLYSPHIEAVAVFRR